ncbi:MAG: TRAP transporter permease [SAR324 cluster bacterium]|nr:TRAP transporter permease [SAR324 cluster bacterium]
MSDETLEAEEILEREQGRVRNYKPWESKLIVSLGVTWALFQLALASFVTLDSIAIRAIHLAFALSMVFLCLPVRGHHQVGIPKYDLFLTLVAIPAALYIYLDFQGLSSRAGLPIPRDIFVSMALLLILLEATRRAIGPALPIVALSFTAYAFLGPYMPDALSFRGVSINKYFNQITLSTEGIYGIPLDVSASTIFLFVLFGALLDRAGAGKFFTDLALSLLGRYKGGPAKAAVASSGLTGLVSGSSIANIVTTGTFTIPLMKKAGMPAHKAAAVEVAASTDGQLMPPIMGAAAFIIAEYVNVPYMDVVRAAFIPAFVSYGALFYLTHLEATKLGMKGMDKKDIPNFYTLIKEGYLHLLPLFMLIFELVGLQHSPQLSVFRAILVLSGLMIYKEFKEGRGGRGAFAALTEGMAQGSRNMMGVALATATAGIIVGVVGLGLGGMINGIVESLSGGNIFLLLLITAVASLILGMGLPTTATYIVMASLTAPVIVHVAALYGLQVPLMAAHLFCFYFGILADDTPPVGLASYAAAAIAGSDPIKTGLQGFMYDLRTAIIPFMFVFNPELLLIGVGSFFDGAMIFAMALLGACAFTSALHGWMLVKSKFYETFALLAACLVLFNPYLIGDMLQGYGLGLVLVVGVWALQKARFKAVALAV